MRNHRFAFLLALVLALGLSVAAAGCGGGDDESSGGSTGGSTDTAAAAEDVSGNVSVLALWTAGEQKSFQAVLDGFNEK
jgi:ABC-type glycerol-3-phosphate transport system substrate-binding protein